MKANDFRDMTREELQNKLTSLKSDLFAQRFKLITGQLDDTNQIKRLKRDIARALTVLKETELREKANA